ncbi:MAG: hypothetical protein KC591_16360, partial [Gemmatimonadetes bacterium]|nr:hypothetical protein [Gemmatimonadota bacterium]
MKNRSWIPSLALALGLFPMVAMAAPGDHLWSRGLGVNGRSATVDAAGNVYVAGTFSGTVDFGGGGVTATGSDFFCSKYDPDGNHLWTRIADPDAFLAVTAISAQPSGGVYVAGNIPKGGTVDFGGGPLGAQGVFGTAWIVQYDTSGNHVFSDEYGSGAINDLDASNSEVAIAAQNSTTLDFGGGPLGTSGDRQAIVAKLASGGAHVWSSAFGDASSQSGQDVGLMSSGEVVLLAAVRGTIDFGAGSHTADANDDIAIAKFDGSGGAQWSDLYQGQFSQFGSLIYSALDVSDVGAIAITGEFANTVDFGGGTLTATITDAFVARFGADGSHQWSGSYGSTAADAGTAIWIGPNGNLFLAGTYRDTISFGGPSLALIGGSDMYVAEISANGAHLWSKGLGSTGFEYSPSVEADAQGNAAISVQGSGVDLGG